jgi:hypothetical protein
MAHRFEGRHTRKHGQIGDHFAPEFSAKKTNLYQRASFGACGGFLPKLRDCDAGLTMKRWVWTTTKTVFPVLGEALSLALAHGKRVWHCEILSKVAISISISSSSGGNLRKWITRAGAS